jgi:hypothetical protein
MMLAREERVDDSDTGIVGINQVLLGQPGNFLSVFDTTACPSVWRVLPGDESLRCGWPG